jgi:hypothetical protein
MTDVRAITSPVRFTVQMEAVGDWSGFLAAAERLAAESCVCNHPPAWHDPHIGCIACGCPGYDPRPEARR